jgi:eukaryotic-like serine/threonine-protein kinase
MLPAGTIIDDKYKVLRAIGSGGFGAVYVASQTQLDRAVAVKMLNTTLLQESDGFARFEREAKAICTIKHKNVVSIYGFGSWQGAPYMVMELLPGVSLQTILESSTLPPLRAVAIMKQVFEGLGAAHSAGIVHRDLKPSNIMILDTPEHKDLVKIIDFGLVKLMPGHGEEGQKLTETGYALGTCSYMAPEQALGGRIDHRVDIYSAGCIFFQCLSGKPPFVADDDVAVMYQHINQRAEPVEALIQDGPLVAAAAAVIDNCMEKQPETRYQSCTEVISALESIERGEYAKLQRFTSRKRKVIATPKLRPMVAVVSAGVVLGAAI